MNSTRQRLLQVLAVLFCLYCFLVSIKLMGGSFKFFGAEFAEQLIRTCSNPLVGLFIGILATSLVQSSSATTSLVVGFVGGGVLPIDYAIPIIMGANIGTTITNILVSFTFVMRREDFRRAFAGATVHDFFNLFSVALLLPLELRFGILHRCAQALTVLFEGAGGVQFTSPLKMIVGPATHAIEDLVLEGLQLSAGVGGTVMLVGSLIAMVVSLIYLVKLMRALIIGRAEAFMHRYLFRNDLTAFLLGAVLTILVQSSSITTSLAIPLVGAGILTLSRCYPYTLGANIGTTCTAILASLATVSIAESGAVNTLGVTAAFAHLMFNVIGIAVFYPLRRLPLWCAQRLAEVAARSKLTAIGFVIGIFFVIPIVVILVTR